MQERIEEAYYKGDAVTVFARQQEAAWMSFKQEVASHRWNVLYDEEEHWRLRRAIVRKLVNNDSDDSSNNNDI